MFVTGFAVSLEAAEPKQQLKLLGHGGPVLGVRYSPDGKILASAGREMTGSYSCIQLWDATTGKALRSFRIADGMLPGFQFSPDGKTIGTAGEEIGVAQLWNVATGKERVTLPTPKDSRGPTLLVVFNPDGKTLATGKGDII